MTPTSSMAAPAIDRSISSSSVSSFGWQNTALPLDVSGDGRITALDALLVINELNSRQVSTATGQLLPRASASEVDRFFDTNGDGVVTPLDALLVLNYLKK